MEHVDVRKKNWLVPFVRAITESFDEQKVRSGLESLPEEPNARFDRWLDQGLRDRGMLAGAPLTKWPKTDEPKRRGEWFLLNILAHQVELLLELRVLLGLGTQTLADQVALLRLIAADCGEFEAAEQLFEVTLEYWGPIGDPRREELAKTMGPAVRTIGSALRAQRLQDHNHPLLGLPLHHVLDYAQTCRLLEIARHQFALQTRIDEDFARRARANSHLQTVQLIEALFALALADGTVSRVEKRLVEHVIELAKLGDSDAKQIWAAMDAPPSPDEFGQAIPDPRTRRFLFQQILLHGLFEGPLSPPEEAFVSALADAFEIGSEQRFAYEGDALTYLENHPELVEAFSLTGLVKRFRDHFTGRLETVVRTNLSRLVTEIRETGELGQLLLKRAQGPLSPEEEEKVRDQLIDICKTVPALAVFAAPGGTVLLPILMRVLPFDLMPSAFSDRDESL